MPAYKEVAADTVPHALQQAAQRALDHACARLHLRLPPVIRWFDGPISDSKEAAPRTIRYPQPIAGLTDSRSWAMWVRADLSPYQTTRVVAHEAAHLYHRRYDGTRALSIPDEEADCDAFAARVVKALGLG